MSSETLYWLMHNGATAYSNVPTNKHAGRHLVIRVIENLALHATEETGHTYVSDRKQELEMGEDRRNIRNARELLVAEGWLTDTGTTRQRAKVWQLHIPGYVWQTVKETEKESDNGRANGRANGRGVGRDIPPLTEQNRTPPLTPQKGERRKRPAGEKELSTEGSELLTQLLDIEDYTGSINITAVRATKRREYLPIVQAWEKEQPSADPVIWCRERLRGYAPRPVQHHTEQLPTGSPECPTCKGSGTYNVPNDDGAGWRAVYCSCTHKDTTETTPERVSPDKASNTYIPAPGAQADPQSDPVQELTRRLKAV